jgi:hypothetical protein
MPTAWVCTGDIDLKVLEGGAQQVSGTGSCLLPANFTSFVVDATFSAADDIAGTIVFTFSGLTHNVPFTASFSAGVLTGTFDQATVGGGGTSIRWDGDFTADRQ